MRKKSSYILGKALSQWVDMVRRFAPLVLFVSVVATGAVFNYTVNNLGIRTDTSGMLSESLHFRRISKEYKKAFPQYYNTLLIVVDGNTSDLALDASRVIADRLRRETHLFPSVYLPGGGRFFEKHSLMYLNPPELFDLSDNLANAQPFLAKLNRDMSLAGLFSMFRHAVKALMDGEDIDLAPLFERVSMAVEASLEGKYYELSWLELMSDKTSGLTGSRRFIVVQPRLDNTKLLPGEGPIKAVRSLIKTVLLDRYSGIRVRITGDIAMEYEELQSVSRGAGIAGLLALIFVGVVLFAGLRSPRLVFATLMTLVMGLIWTAGFAAAAIGHLNLISVAFAVLYIGLGVDSAIHFCLRYRELIGQGSTHANALTRTAQNIGSSLSICACTTAIGFYAFIPTAFAGVAELGLISGTGMFIGLIMNLTILPAFLSLMPLPKASNGGGGTVGGVKSFLIALPFSRRIEIRVGAAMLGFGALVLLTHVTFDRNPLNLRDPETESVSTFRELLAQGNSSPWSLKILAPDRKAAKEYSDRLRELDSVDKSITLSDFVPTGQDEKLGSIDDMSLILGPEFMENIRKHVRTIPERIAVLRDFLAVLGTFAETNTGHPLAGPARRLSSSLSRFEASLEGREEAMKAKMLDKLESSILASLPGRLRSLKASLSAERVTLEDLPDELAERWVSRDGRYRVEVFPCEDLNDGESMRRFVTAVQKVAPDATGYPVIILEAGDAVVRAFQQAFVMSFAAITVLLFVLMRRKSDVLLVLSPLLLAGAFTGAASVLLDIPFNFANVIALPLILGIGVDNGIHMVHRMRTAPPKDGHLLGTSTARAVLFSALTTVCSFGNLALSPHRGMASMGQLLSIGIGFTLLCTLIVLPALIKPFSHKKPGPPPRNGIFDE